jgi:hypothetical protein
MDRDTVSVSQEMRFMNAKGGKLEEGLSQAMHAIDTQVARAMQRSPSERDVMGVQKWEPYDTRVEHITAYILNELGDNSVGLDSVLVLAQAFTKALRLATEDLGSDGLGAVRTSYCVDAMEKVTRDAGRALAELRTSSIT